VDDCAPSYGEDDSVECSGPALMEERALPCPKLAEMPMSMCLDDAPRRAKGRPGRTGSLFRLNRKRYEEMKEEGGKVEF